MSYKCQMQMSDTLSQDSMVFCYIQILGITPSIFMYVLYTLKKCPVLYGQNGIIWFPPSVFFLSLSCYLSVFTFAYWMFFVLFFGWQFLCGVCVFVCYKKGRNTQHLLRLDYICQVQTKYKTPYCLSCHCQTICFHLVCIRCSSCLKMTQLVFI